VGGETTNSRRAKRGSVQFRLSKHFDNKKNWMFGDSVKGSKASANLYSLIETAKANGIEPYTYLRPQRSPRFLNAIGEDRGNL
jgi:hypothetical protein